MKAIVRVIILVATVLISVSGFAAGSKPKGEGYLKSDIADARFGTGDREKLLKLAYGLGTDLNKQVFGQEAAINAIQSKLIQYLEGYPNRTGEPVMMNMIGLPGIGKSAILEHLKKSGFPVAEFDAQNFAGDRFGGTRSLDDMIAHAVLTHEKDKPLIIVVEELDKLVERNAVTGTETTSSAIGTMNMISSEGKVHLHGGRFIPVSNIMFLTTMNLSPVEFETFSKEVLGVEKSYYDYALEDFAKFDAWIRGQPSARYKVLARMFRSNTVGRFGANTTIMQPLNEESYRKIISLQVERAIRQNVLDKNAAKRVTVDVHPSVIDFFFKEAVYAPSGARETVSLSNALMEQVVSFGVKAVGPGVTNVDRPRHIEVRYHHEMNRVFMRVTEMILEANSKTKLRPAGAIAFELKYDPASRRFLAPTDIQAVKPEYAKPSQEEIAERPVTKREVFEARFPKAQARIGGLREALAEHLFGQTDAISTLATDLEAYYGRQGAAKKEPSSRAFAGFPGIGKSELFLRAAETLELPVARLNMQKFASDSNETVEAFNKALAQVIDAAKENSKDGRYILLLEELDKVFEISPEGKFENRPIMATIKDMLNDGRIHINSDYSARVIDVRDAFVGITMNFAVDRFGFKADPRLTTIEDVISAWKRLKSSPAAVKDILGSMFLPDTVSRLMTQLVIMKPLDRPAYTKIIETQAEKVKGSRLLDKDGRNIGQIEMKTTPAYRQYLFTESVIPSEGARNTTKSANSMISTDLEYVLARLPRSSKYAKAPLTIIFDYSEAKQVVRFRIQRTEFPDEPALKVEDRSVALKFPSTRARGRVSEDRMHTSAHEFGHAFTGLRLGARFEYVVVVPTPDAGGYVKPNGQGRHAIDMVARLYMLLGSRAFERIVFSPNPMAPESVLRISAGPSRDIQMATTTLYNVLYELGMNPGGGTLDRNFSTGMGKYASYADMPNELAEKLGLILRDIENEIVRETLAEHSREWYVEKIIELARAGSMTEKEFYNLIGRKLPANNRQSVGSINEHFRSLFAKALVKPTSQEAVAAKDRAGLSKMTPAEQSERALDKFATIVGSHLNPAPARMVRSCEALFKAM